MTHAHRRPLACTLLGLVALLGADADLAAASVMAPSARSLVARLPAGANPTQVAGERLASGAGAQSRPLSTAPLSGLGASRAPQPLVLSVRASPVQLGNRGGSVEVTGSLLRAATCQLRLLSQQSFPVVYASNVRRCSRSFSARVTVGANPTPIERSIAFALVARNGRRHFAGLFYISLAPRAQPAASSKPAAGAPATVRATTTVPARARVPAVSPPAPTTTTTPPVPDSAPPAPATTTTSPGAAALPTTTTPAVPAPGPANPPQVLEGSPNWSGYVVKGGPFSSVSGTFTVPSLSAGADCSEVESQWAGIDGGAGPADQDLIQAGVDEASMDPTGASTCAAGQFYAWAWWEILPSAATNVYSVPVHAGDSVTVTISEQGGGTWQISLSDNADGQGFSLEQPYNGPGQTAEWVTEAPAAPEGNNQICPTTAVTSFSGYDVCPLAPYSPPVDYRGLSLPQASSATELDEVAMVQGGNVVSTPSQVNSLADLLARGFTTSYTG